MTPESPDDLTERANRAYWETDAGVNHIADALDASKSALYGMIRPLETGEACDVCGGPLVWENRTARDRGDTSCPGCEADATAGATGTAAPDPRAAAVAASAGGARSGHGARAEASPSPDLAMAASPGGGTPAAIASGQARALGGAVLVGLGAGFLAAVMLLRRR